MKYNVIMKETIKMFLCLVTILYILSIDINIFIILISSIILSIFTLNISPFINSSDTNNDYELHLENNIQPYEYSLEVFEDSKKHPVNSLQPPVISLQPQVNSLQPREGKTIVDIKPSIISIHFSGFSVLDDRVINFIAEEINKVLLKECNGDVFVRAGLHQIIEYGGEKSNWLTYFIVYGYVRELDLKKILGEANAGFDKLKAKGDYVYEYNTSTVVFHFSIIPKGQTTKLI